MAVQITGAWNFPTRVITGAGRIAELPDACRAHGITRPLLVTDRGLAENDLIAGIVRRVRDAGIPISVFSDVKGNPTESNLYAGVAAFKAGGHDGVVAVGGGSALDVGAAPPGVGFRGYRRLVDPRQYLCRSDHRGADDGRDRLRGWPRRCDYP